MLPLPPALRWLIGWFTVFLADLGAVRRGGFDIATLRALLRDRHLRVETPAGQPDGAPLKMVTVIHLDGDLTCTVEARWLRSASATERAAVLAEQEVAVRARLDRLAGVQALLGVLVRGAVLAAVAWVLGVMVVEGRLAATANEMVRQTLLSSLPAVLLAAVPPLVRRLVAARVRRLVSPSMPPANPGRKAA